MKEGLICIWDESDMSDGLEVDYEELKRTQAPAACARIAGSAFSM